MWSLLFAALLAQEIATATAPKPVAPITSYQITTLTFELHPEPRFVITYVDNNGTAYRDAHRGPSVIKDGTGGPDQVNPDGADVLLRQINTGNFTTTSLVKRMLQHLIEHGKIPPATVTGTPGPTAPQPERAAPAKPIKK